MTPSAISRRACRRRNFGEEAPVFVEHAGDIGQEQEARRLDRGGHGTRHGVGVDVVGLAAGADSDRGDDRDHVGLLEGVEHGGRDPPRFADKAQIDHDLHTVLDARAHHLFRLDQPGVLAGQPDRETALGVDRRHQLLVDGAREHHLDHVHRLAVSHPQPVDKAALQAEALKHLADLRPAAMHDDRVDADLLQQHDVAGKQIAAGSHRVPAIFDDDRAAGIPAHIGQRFGQDRGLRDRVGGWRRGGGGGIGEAHRAGVYRVLPRIATRATGAAGRA